jgi:hypothetical protein
LGELASRLESTRRVTSRVRVESVKISTRVDSPTRRVISRGGSSDNCPWCFGVLVLLGW